MAQVRFRARGDFPDSEATTIEAFAPSGSPEIIDRFPNDTQAIVVDTLDVFAGGGVVRLDDRESRTAELLPIGRGCMLADGTLRTVQRAAFVAAGASVVRLGGRDQSEAGVGSRKVAFRASGGEVHASAELNGSRLDLAVVSLGSALSGASTSTNDGTERLIATGGGSGVAGPGLDSYDIIELSPDGSATVTTAPMVEPRRAHGSAVLANGDVLVVGGRTFAEGGPLDTAELLTDVGSGSGEARSVGPLDAGRVDPKVVTLDDGTTWVLGGYAAAPVLFFDPLSETFVDSGQRTLALDGLGVAALPGGRVASFGDAMPGRQGNVVRLFRRTPPYYAGRSLETDDIELGPLGVPALDGVSGVGLFDGRLLLAGHDPLATEVRAFAIDLARGFVDEVDLDPSGAPPAALLRLSDGAVVAMRDSGSEWMRFSLGTRFDNPPSILLADDLLLDGPGRFRVVDGVTLEALTNNARVEVASLSFVDVQIDVTVQGALDVLLLGEAGLVRVTVGATSAGLPLSCGVARMDGDTLRVTRRGDEVSVGSGDESRTCTVGNIGERVRLAFRLNAGARLGAVQVRRLQLEDAAQ